MIDMGIGGDFGASISTPDGRMPEIGDLWLCSMETGIWTPVALLDAMGKYKNLDRSLDLWRELLRRGQIDWDPFDTPMGAPEFPHGGYLGEHRLFEVVPDTRWIVLSGGTFTRHRYRALWDHVSTGVPGNGYGVGDGTTTFSVPNYWAPKPGTALWYACAE